MTDTFGVPAGPIETPPAGFRPEGEQSVILRDTLRAAGVELGAYDERIVSWLSGWEWSTVATVASWIYRASTSQTNRPMSELPDARTALHAELMAGEDPDSPEYAAAEARIRRLLDDHRDQVLAEHPDAAGGLTMPELPRTTAAGRNYLQYFAQAQDIGKPMHVYREPGGRPGNGVSRPALDRLRKDGLVQLGDYRPLHGKPVLVTDLGRAVLNAHTAEN